MSAARIRPRRPAALDRVEVLSRVDLPVAADRFLGPGVGSGSRRRWPCPAPGHPASDRKPAVGVFRGDDGIQRWKCRTCGTHGTAVDLVMHTQQREFREALRLLDDLAGQLQPADPQPSAPAESASPARVPRDVLLSQYDLAGLADELLGVGKGRGRSRSWPCPLPTHGPQTGATPPVTIRRDSSGIQRWRCHACGDGGTAIDLLMHTRNLDVGDAFAVLLDRLGGVEVPQLRPAPPRLPAPPVQPTRRSRQAIASYIARCEELLWGDMGLPGRRLLANRGLEEPVLRAHRIGYDPGPALLSRARGLPHGGPAIVLPVTGGFDQPQYVQARYLAVNDRRYDQPVEELAGPAPRFDFLRTVGDEIDPGVVVVSEGKFDGLSAVQAGYAAAAVLSAGLPDERVAKALLERYPDRRYVLAFDDNKAGHDGAAKLASELVQAGVDPAQVTRLVPPHTDLNGWLQASRGEFAAQLRQGVNDAPLAIPPDSPPTPDPRLATERGPAALPAGRTPTYTVAVWHAPALPEDPPPRDPAYTFALPAGLLAAEAAAERAEDRRGDLHQLAAELAVDVGGGADPIRYAEPYRTLAVDYQFAGIRPIAIGDVLVVTDPEARAATLECTADGVTRTRAPSLAVDPAATGTASPSDGSYLVSIVKPDAEVADRLHHVHDLALPASLVDRYVTEITEAGGRVRPDAAAASVAWELSVWDAAQQVEPFASMSASMHAVGGALRPGDTVVVEPPAGPASALQLLDEGNWQPLPVSPASEPAVHQIHILHPVPSQALQGAALQATDYDLVHTLAIPTASLSMPPLDVVAGNQTPERLAELVYVVAGNGDPADSPEPLAGLARRYQESSLRPVGAGDVVLITAPWAGHAATALQCTREGEFTPLAEPPQFGPPGHNPDPPQLQWSPDGGVTLGDRAETQLRKFLASQAASAPALALDAGL